MAKPSSAVKAYKRKRKRFIKHYCSRCKICSSGAFCYNNFYIIDKNNFVGSIYPNLLGQNGYFNTINENLVRMKFQYLFCHNCVNYAPSKVFLYECVELDRCLSAFKNVVTIRSGFTEEAAHKKSKIKEKKEITAMFFTNSVDEFK